MPRSEIIDLWKSRTSPDWDYYAAVDTPESLEGFWQPESIFRREFDALDLTAALEIASGTGRHAEIAAPLAGSLIVLDTSVDAMEECRTRLSEYSNVEFCLSRDGVSLPVADGSLTAIYSYDAMVHFEVETMANYLQEIGRALAAGGTSLLHHSNNSSQPETPLLQSTRWRNYMTEDLIRHLAQRAGLRVARIHLMGGKDEALDALTVFEKAAS